MRKDMTLAKGLLILFFFFGAYALVGTIEAHDADNRQPLTMGGE